MAMRVARPVTVKKRLGVGTPVGTSRRARRRSSHARAGRPRLMKVVVSLGSVDPLDPLMREPVRGLAARKPAVAISRRLRSRKTPVCNFRCRRLLFDTHAMTERDLVHRVRTPRACLMFAGADGKDRAGT